MDIVLRDATQQDYKGVKNLFSQLSDFHDRLYGTPPNPDRLGLTEAELAEDLARPDSKMIVAVDRDNSKIAGVIYADCHNLTEDPLSPTDRIVRIRTLDIDEPYRAQKLGKTMISAVEKWSQSLGAGFIQLRVDNLNFNAAAAYKKMEYVTKTEPAGKLDFMQADEFSTIMIKPFKL